MAGFSKGSRMGRTQSHTHRWINSPNKGRQVCTACGMLKEVIWNTKFQANETIYTSKDGNNSLEYLPCLVENYTL